MADWDFFKDETVEFMDSRFEDIHTLFISGKIKKMSQLAKRSPTLVAELLNLNYGSYHVKLRAPEGFTSLQINIMAFAFQIDPIIIHDIIQKQSLSIIKEKVEKFLQKKDDIQSE